MLAQIQAWAIIVLLLIVFIGFVLFMRRLNSLQQAIIRQSTDHRDTQNLIEQRHTSTQEQIHQLQLAQLSTNTTVSTTQQEM
jgi:hypothetical protein